MVPGGGVGDCRVVGGENGGRDGSSVRFHKSEGTALRRIRRCAKFSALGTSSYAGGEKSCRCSGRVGFLGRPDPHCVICGPGQDAARGLVYG